MQRSSKLFETWRKRFGAGQRRCLLHPDEHNPDFKEVYKKDDPSIQMLASLALILLGVTGMRDCGDGLGRAVLLGFGSSPESPRPGDNVSTWIAYDLPAPAITAGTATYSFSLNGIPFTPSVEDLCTQTLCPKEPGLYNETSSSIFPQIAGKIVAQIQWRDPDDTLIWCVENTWRV